MYIIYIYILCILYIYIYIYYVYMIIIYKYTYLLISNIFKSTVHAVYHITSYHIRAPVSISLVSKGSDSSRGSETALFKEGSEGDVAFSLNVAYGSRALLWQLSPSGDPCWSHVEANKNPGHL